MAELSFICYTPKNEKIVVDSVVSYELSKTAQAPADGLRLTFLSDKKLPCISRVLAYDGDELIFNGIADTQRQSVTSTGISCFIYARSTACVLLDNEAKPYTYDSPSAIFLFNRYARDFGFKSKLPSVWCDTYYQVGKGTSCYGAINDMVYALTGKNVLVTPQNELCVLNENAVVNMEHYNVLSKKYVINRGDAYSQIDYMTDDENGYSHHFKSRFFESEGISRSKKINLAALPIWQQKRKLKNLLSSSSDNYETIELVLEGIHNFNLYDRVKCDGTIDDGDDFYISDICISAKTDYCKTRITASKSIDLREVNYVAE